MFNFSKALESLTTFPKNPARLMAFDTETTGVHLHYDSSPFMLSVMYDNGEVFLWEAEVNPFTRRCYWSKEDQIEIAAVFQDASTLLIASNAKFDVRAVSKIIECDSAEILCRSHDTLLQHHRLNNQENHGLKSAAMKYAGIPDSDESDLIEAVKQARTFAKKLGWAVASKETCPQQTRAPAGKGWAVMDYWLPRAVAKYQQLPADHPWWTLCSSYCSTDTLRSLLLFQAFSESLESDNGTQHYLENRSALPISYLTEERGITFNTAKAKELITKFQIDQHNAKFAIQYSLGTLSPVNTDSPKALRNALYFTLGLPVLQWTKPKKESSKPQPSTDSDAIIEIANAFKPDDLTSLDPPKWDKTVEPYKDFKRRITLWGEMLVAEEKPSADQVFAFCSAVLNYKQASTAIRYLTGYLHSSQQHPLHPDFGVLHPSLNPVGTKGLRYSGSNPNPQNISRGGKIKKGTEWLRKEERSLRSVFGPVPGREWWTVDYSQIQPVIFAMCCGDKAFAAAMRRGEDPYLFVARRIYDIPEGTEPEKYQRDNAKTVLLAFLFGAGEHRLSQSSGVSGLYALLKTKMPAVLAFMQQIESQIRNHGFVSTLGGYKLLIPEDKPHSGVNYICQSGEGEIVKRAQYGIQAYLDSVLPSPLDMFMTLWVHDEIIFDCQLGHGRRYMGAILRIMLDAAASFGVPCKASVKYITDNWSNGKKITLTQKASHREMHSL